MASNPNRLRFDLKGPLGKVSVGVGTVAAAATLAGAAHGAGRTPEAKVSPAPIMNTTDAKLVRLDNEIRAAAKVEGSKHHNFIDDKNVRLFGQPAELLVATRKEVVQGHVQYERFVSYVLRGHKVPGTSFVDVVSTPTYEFGEHFTTALELTVQNPGQPNEIYRAEVDNSSGGAGFNIQRHSLIDPVAYQIDKDFTHSLEEQAQRDINAAKQQAHIGNKPAA